jgi:ribosomal protein S18 acetylase RimI-like enzyme
MIADDYPRAILEEREGPNTPQEALDPPWIWRKDGDAGTGSLVDAYRTVWTQEPWNEVFGQQAATAELETALEADGSVILYATAGDRDTEVLEETSYPGDPNYLTLDGEDPPDEDRFFEDLEEPTAVGFTWAYDADEATDRMPDEEGFDEILADDAAYIAELGVVPGYQSQGIGSRLSEELLSELEDTYDQAVLRTNPDAEKAINLYEDLGFERTGYRDEVYTDRVYLTKDLGGEG